MNDDSSIAACRTPRVRHLPARFIINHTDTMDEGGGDSVLHPSV